MAFQKYQSANNARGQLDAGINASIKNFVLQSGEGAKFPSSGPFIVTIEVFSTDTPTIGAVTKREIILIDSRSGDTFTINTSGRGWGTCPPDDTSNTPGNTAFSFPAGAYVSLYTTEELISDIQDEVERLETDKSDDSDVVHLAGTETVTGDKTFSGNIDFDTNFPTTPSAAPTTDYQVANKKYVDDEIVAASTVTQLLDTRTLGENIDGTTTPQAVYVSDGSGSRTSGRLYKAQSDITTYDDANKFAGFFVDNQTSGNSNTYITQGIVPGFSGLTIGGKVYLDTTAGTITQDRDDPSLVEIGFAYSATEIFIDYKPFIPQTINGQSNDYDNATTTQTITIDIGYDWNILEFGIVVSQQGAGGPDYTTVGIYGKWYAVESGLKVMRLVEETEVNANTGQKTTSWLNGNTSTFGLRSSAYGNTTSGVITRIDEVYKDGTNVVIEVTVDATSQGYTDKKISITDIAVIR